jgi:hypothetical protein
VDGFNVKPEQGPGDTAAEETSSKPCHVHAEKQ